MNTAVKIQEVRIKHISISKESIIAELIDGRIISVPLAWSWRLSEATQKQRANWEIIGNGQGVHWPDIDEDISAEGMLSGCPAPRPQPLINQTQKPRGKKAPSNIKRLYEI